MKSERTPRMEAVVLRHTDWGEADRLLTLFTREQGKQRCIAKGVRRLRSRKAGHLEPFTCVSLLLARGRDLWIITQAQTVDAYMPLRDDLVRTGYASYIVELVDRFTYEEGENRALYRLLCETLQRLSLEEDLLPVVRFFELHLLDLLGFRPRLFECVSCGEEIKAQDQFFSAGEGGVICPNCIAKFPSARPVSMKVLKYLRFYQRSTWFEVHRVGLPQGVRAEMEAMLQYLLTHLLERGLNSPAFIREIQKNGGYITT